MRLDSWRGNPHASDTGGWQHVQGHDRDLKRNLGKGLGQQFRRETETPVWFRGSKPGVV